MEEEEGLVTHLGLDYLTLYIGQDGIIEGYAEYRADLYLFQLQDIIIGPLAVKKPPRRRAWKFSDIYKVKGFNERAKDIYRKAMKAKKFTC